MQVLFGQSKAKKARASLNADLIRTGQEVKRASSESECKPLFGQSKEKKARASPNASLIRTGQGEKSESESECKPHSDRVRQKKRERVRMQVSFGQSKAKKARASLNAGLIRTA